jgi:hypothetical protein
MASIGVIILLIFIGIILVVAGVAIFNYTTTKPPTDVPIPCTYSVVPDTNIVGFHLPNMPIKDVSEPGCQSKCDDTCDDESGVCSCQWYNYDQKTRECWLKKGTPTPKYITGFRRNDTSQPKCAAYSTYTDYNIDGFNMPNMPLANKTEDECQTACNTNKCDWYNYDETGKKCWLKKATDKKESSTGFMTHATAL